MLPPRKKKIPELKTKNFSTNGGLFVQYICIYIETAKYESTCKFQRVAAENERISKRNLKIIRGKFA